MTSSCPLLTVATAMPVSGLSGRLGEHECRDEVAVCEGFSTPVSRGCGASCLPASKNLHNSGNRQPLPIAVNGTRDPKHTTPLMDGYKDLICTLRNLIAPAPCCRAIHPSSNIPFRSSAVFCPLSTTVMSRPFAVISNVFHLPPAFGIGLIST